MGSNCVGGVEVARFVGYVVPGGTLRAVHGCHNPNRNMKYAKLLYCVSPDQERCLSKCRGGVSASLDYLELLMKNSTVANEKRMSSVLGGWLMMALQRFSSGQTRQILKESR